MRLHDFWSYWKQKAAQLKYELAALYWAYRDPRVPWYAKLFIAVVIGYALSPIDLIPDFIPVIGYLDDLIIIPAGIYLAVKMIPIGVLTECRIKARTTRMSSRAKWVIAGLIISLWVLIVLLVTKFIMQAFF
jgi:uncharacterized membrane protein YkvA (DUF1232 family)